MITKRGVLYKDMKVVVVSLEDFMLSVFYESSRDLHGLWSITLPLMNHCESTRGKDMSAVGHIHVTKRPCVRSMVFTENVIRGQMEYEELLRDTKTVKTNPAEIPRSNIASILDKNEVA